MIEKIRLKKEHIGFLDDDEQDLPCWYYRMVIAPNWISNGYWAIHKSLVINADDFENEETIRKYFQISEDDEFAFLEYEDEIMKALFPKTRTKHIEANEMVIRSKGYIQFKDYDNNHEAYFDLQYIELFKITELWGVGLEPYVNKAKGEPTFIIMPCNF